MRAPVHFNRRMKLSVPIMRRKLYSIHIRTNVTRSEETGVNTQQDTEPVDGRSRRAARVHSENHSRILDAARRILDSTGGAGLTAHDIAQEAGVSDATVYNHFSGSVAEILVCVGNAVVDDAVVAISARRDAEGPAAASRALPAEVCKSVASLGRGAYEILRARDSSGASFFGREPKPEEILSQFLFDAGITDNDERAAAVRMIVHLVRGAIFSFALHAAEDFARETATTAQHLIDVGATATDSCLSVLGLSLDSGNNSH